MPNECYDRQFFTSRLVEVMKFIATGTLSVALNTVIIILLTQRLGLPYQVSIIACFLVVTFISFCLNRFWTFQLRRQSKRADLGRYVCVGIFQLVMSLLLTTFCVEVLHLQYVLAVVILSILLAPITFLLHRRVSFRIKWFERGSQ
ncbi:MAG TPA: GtrA family protein [Steroidobacteraceae bacterium]|jgi:putative flippase GtrA|nr:GtrA family protein [Steroidobacteraceae bacterium]